MTDIKSGTGKKSQKKMRFSRVMALYIAVALVISFIPGGILALQIMGDSLPVPYFITTPMISAGTAHTLALRYDGTVWAWGANYDGQLGIAFIDMYIAGMLHLRYIVT